MNRKITYTDAKNISNIETQLSTMFTANDLNELLFEVNKHQPISLQKYSELFKKIQTHDLSDAIVQELDSWIDKSGFIIDAVEYHNRYGIASIDDKLLIEKYINDNFKINEDYIIDNNKFMITADTFKIILMIGNKFPGKSVDIDKYINYYFLVEKRMYSYSKYMQMYMN